MQPMPLAGQRRIIRAWPRPLHATNTKLMHQIDNFVAFGSSPFQSTTDFFRPDAPTR